LYATNAAYGGDPCQGTRKQLIVEAACVAEEGGPKLRLPFRLLIAATDDRGAKGLTEARIVVENENEPPRFPTQTRTIMENTLTGVNVGQPLKFSDDDKDDVLLFVTGGNGAQLFEVNRETGQITTDLRGSALDYEAQSEYTLRIKASDNGPTGSQSTWTDITIQLEDKNEPPQVLNSRFVVSEAESVGYSIGTLNAEDEDGGDEMTFRIDSGNGRNQFTINYATGEIIIRKKLDYETKKTHTLTVIATDKGSLSTTATCVIVVADANEEPIWDPAADYTRNVDEGTGIRAVSGGVTAADDEDNGDVVQYSIDATRGTGKDLFTVHQTTGTLSTIDREYDYETQAQR